MEMAHGRGMQGKAGCLSHLVLWLRRQGPLPLSLLGRSRDKLCKQVIVGRSTGRRLAAGCLQAKLRQNELNVDAYRVKVLDAVVT